MSIALKETIRQPKVLELGSGKLAHFGEQVAETYMADRCAAGDREVACQDVMEQACNTYSRAFTCGPGDTVIGHGFLTLTCQHCEQRATGRRSCTCERVQAQPSLEIERLVNLIGASRGVAAPETFPIGAAGTTVVPAERGNVLRGALILGVLLVAGYFLYQRYRKRG